MLNFGKVVALAGLILFLFSLAVIPVQAESEADLSLDAEPVHWWLGCFDCHTLHETENLSLISEVIDTDYLPPDYALKSGLREVVNHSIRIRDVRAADCKLRYRQGLELPHPE